MQPAQLTAQDRQDLQRVEQYLGSLTTVKADFVQTTNNTDLYRGHFYLKRPGKMRLEYEPPIAYMYIADGTWLTYYDADLRQRKDVPLGSTIADFITRANVRLSGDVTVIKVSRGNNLLSVQLVQTDKPEDGSPDPELHRQPDDPAELGVGGPAGHRHPGRPDRHPARGAAGQLPVRRAAPQGKPLSGGGPDAGMADAGMARPLRQ